MHFEHNFKHSYPQYHRISINENIQNSVSSCTTHSISPCTVSSYLTISRVLMHTKLNTRRPIQSYPISLTQTVNNARRWCGFKDVYAQHGNADRRLDGAHPRGGMPRVLLRRHTCVNYDAGMRLVMPAWHATGAPHGTQQQEARIKLINRDERKYGIGLTRKRFCAPPSVESRSIANNFANFAACVDGNWWKFFSLEDP